MNPQKKLCSRIARVLFGAFWPFLKGRHGPNKRRNPPKTPGKEHLYRQRRPYSDEHPPKTVADALDRIELNAEVVEDWRERRMGDRFERVSKEIGNGTYDRRSHTYRGQPEAVMAAVIKENSFLERWLRRARRRERAVRIQKYAWKRPPRKSPLGNGAAKFPGKGGRNLLAKNRRRGHEGNRNGRNHR